MRMTCVHGRMFMEMVPVLMIVAVLMFSCKMGVQVKMFFAKQEKGPGNHNRNRNEKKRIGWFLEDQE